MNFSCDRCHRTFATGDEPVPGRVYRLPCKCGNTIVVEIDEPSPGPRPAPPLPWRRGATPLPGIVRPVAVPPALSTSVAGRPPARDPTVTASIAEEGAPRSLAAPQRVQETVADDPFVRAMSANPDLRDVTPTNVPPPLARRDPDALPEESVGYRLSGAVSFDDLLRRVRRSAFLIGSGAGALGAVAVVGLIAVMRMAGTPAAPAGAAQREAVRTAEATGGAAPPGSASPARSTPSVPAGTTDGPPAAVAPPPRPTQPPDLASRARDALAVPKKLAAATPITPRPADGAARTSHDSRTPGAEPGIPEEALRSNPNPSDDRSPISPTTRSAPAAPPAPSHEPEPGRTANAATPAPSDEEPADPGRALEERDVIAALRSRRAALDACAAGPEGAATARGQRFHLIVIVGPNGRVYDARVDDPEIDSSALGACLVRVAQALSFTPFDGDPVRVDLPLRYGNTE